MLHEAESRGVVVEPRVRAALLSGAPVVALESTIISHGMPFPDNLATACAVEDIVRSHGAVPATIAILQGVPHIGLSKGQLELLARLGTRARKTARRDVAYVASQKMDGATTVSATMFFAHSVGIRVFVTGGIGGVHRNGQETMDVSSDLTELGRTPVAVVCAGAKSILDIPRTLEYLETQGVPVATLGSDAFPAFFTRDSGCKTPLRVDSTDACAQLIAASRRLSVGGGILVAVPVPEEHAAEGRAVEEATKQALEMAQSAGVSGADITPFLLAKVKELSGGASLVANVALAKNNAAVGSKIAVALSLLEARGEARL